MLVMHLDHNKVMPYIQNAKHLFQNATGYTKAWNELDIEDNDDDVVYDDRSLAWKQLAATRKREKGPRKGACATLVTDKKKFKPHLLCGVLGPNKQVRELGLNVTVSIAALLYREAVPESLFSRGPLRELVLAAREALAQSWEDY